MTGRTVRLYEGVLVRFFAEKVAAGAVGLLELCQDSFQHSEHGGCASSVRRALRAVDDDVSGASELLVRLRLKYGDGGVHGDQRLAKVLNVYRAVADLAEDLVEVEPERRADGHRIDPLVHDSSPSVGSPEPSSALGVVGASEPTEGDPPSEVRSCEEAAALVSKALDILARAWDEVAPLWKKGPEIQRLFGGPILSAETRLWAASAILDRLALGEEVDA